MSELTTASQPSNLQELLDVQGETRELLSYLGNRLGPVSNPSPQEKADSPVREGHISTAVAGQYQINRTIKTLIDELAI